MNARDNIFENLYALMKKEVEFLRELLGLLKEMELSINDKEEEQIFHLAEQRTTLTKKLKIHQKQRTAVIKNCLSSFNSKTDDNKLTSKFFTKVMSENDEIGTQILSLRDQMLILIKKIDLQKKQVESVVGQSPLELSPEFAPLEKEEKTILKTIDPEDAMQA